MIGRNLAHYEIVAPLGKGGMGEVFRARDTKLDREVALKVLPREMSSDPERLARFDREARTLATLQHPNVASIYGFDDADGERFLVMELVEGEDLSDRIARDGALPGQDVLEIAIQIAAGLEAAHDEGIVHRDLKPANVKLGADGAVKILDFGLARAYGGDEGGSDPAMSPTITAAMTRAGTILGTAAYMSPEQARGRTVDRRSDIWAFGCVLFELLTGRTAFAGDTVTDVLAAIVHKEPDWDALPQGLHPAVGELLRRCLRKDRRRRLRDAGDVRCILEDVREGVAPSDTQGRSAASGPRWRSLAFVAVLALFVGAGTVFLFDRSDTGESLGPAPVTRTTIALPDGQRQPRLMMSPLAVSPDGRTVAYAARDAGGTVRLFLRPLDSYEVREIPASEDADMPFFSADGRWIGFFANGYLNKASVDGGAPVRLTRVGEAFGASWGPDGDIVYAPTINAGLWRIDGDGGEPEQLTRPDFQTTGYANVWPKHLPGTDEILFLVWGTMGDETATAQAVDLKTGDWRSVRRGFTAGEDYLSSGHLVYADVRGSGNLFAASFDPARGIPAEGGIPVLDDVRFFDSQSATPYFAASENGTVVYVSNDFGAATVMWVDSEGNSDPIVETPMIVSGLQLSPDERSAAFQDEKGGVWLLDLRRGSIEALLRHDDLFTTSFVWGPDGNRMILSSNDAGSWDLYEYDLTTRALPRLILKRDFDQHVAAWEGETIIFTDDNPETGSDIWMMSLGDEPSPVESTSANEFMPALSPDGSLLAFVSDESGRSEVYVRKLPGGVRRAVSLDGGREPVWSGDGTTLYFRNGYSFLAVDIGGEVDFVVSDPRELFRAHLDANTYHGSRPYYDASVEGKRFLAVSDRATTEFRVITNWFQEVEDRVPAR